MAPADLAAGAPQHGLKSLIDGAELVEEADTLGNCRRWRAYGIDPLPASRTA